MGYMSLTHLVGGAQIYGLVSLAAGKRNALCSTRSFGEASQSEY